MRSNLVVSDAVPPSLLSAIEELIRSSGPAAIGLASAYVSRRGLAAMNEVLDRCGVEDRRLLAGTSDEITQPAALALALDSGWGLRLGSAGANRFHPKVFVGGASFDPDGAVTDVCCMYVGSANLTQPALERNTEASVLVSGAPPELGPDVLFGRLWQQAAPATAQLLDDYSSRFAASSRRRSTGTLMALGVVDDPAVPSGSVAAPAARAPAPSVPVMEEDYAAAVWAGLESTTGEYTYQVEFPQSAGRVLGRFALGAGDALLSVVCEDGQMRRMRFAFYGDNGMFRLNIPREVPGVTEARDSRSGIALVERGDAVGDPLRLRILPPGPEVEQVVLRSELFGTLASTSTRLYGWF